MINTILINAMIKYHSGIGYLTVRKKTVYTSLCLIMIEIMAGSQKDNSYMTRKTAVWSLKVQLMHAKDTK